jgi:hypothetical protein
MNNTRNREQQDYTIERMTMMVVVLTVVVRCKFAVKLGAVKLGAVKRFHLKS